MWTRAGCRALVPVLLAALAGGCQANGAPPEPQARLMQQVAGYARLAGEADDPRVLAALRAVPRAAFVLPEWRAEAEADTALPIAHGQTISQPTIVALMTHLIRPEAGHRVLEIGTGSGYQAAVLSPLVDEVFTIEIIPELAASARAALARQGYANVQVRVGDGFAGWPEEAPFDGILVTAAAPRVPAPLVAQLKPGGRMVIPVGPAGGIQRLVLVEKDKDGVVRERPVTDVRFVPMTGEAQRK
ncbi:MAG: protein-L-isoaspartate(D-aspartate) O-methyltransferase [Sphingomonadaceae bacterium]